jgi:hypothetical protein
MNVTHPDQMYTHEFEFAQDSQWGEVVLMLAARTGDTGLLMDPEAEPDPDTGRFPKGSAIKLGPRMFSDVQLGMLDGPARDMRKPDPVYVKAITGLGGLTKRQRRQARKLRRAAKRQGSELTTIQLIEIVSR